MAGMGEIFDSVTEMFTRDEEAKRAEAVNPSDVRPGTRNGSVLTVQEALAKAVDLDYSSAPGTFGPRTKDAYAKWQRHLGYSGSAADGVPGPKSLKKLGAEYGFTVRKGDGGGPPADGRVASPVPGHSISYAYGVPNARYQEGHHTGDDYAAPEGTLVVAVRDGTIKWSNAWGNEYGNWIGLQADNGRVYVYCHLSWRDVHPGEEVKAGQRIGRVGSTGNVTGPHLHFEDHPAGRFHYGHGRKPAW